MELGAYYILLQISLEVNSLGCAVRKIYFGRAKTLKRPLCPGRV